MANPPPPYANITGISRAAMKDNAQESITNYNGNARPGELIVDQNTDILYVGNALGQLTVLATPSGTTTWALLSDKNNASGPVSIALGTLAGATSQGTDAIAIGNIAAEISQGIGAVAIGYSAGYSNQGANAVSIGLGAGSADQGVNAVAVGVGAGNDAQGANAVAIGNEAGVTSQGNNSIIINATGATLNQTTPNTFTVAPVRNDIANTAQVMFYNATSKEITYGNTISVAGNVAGNYFIGNGSQLSGLSTSSINNGTSNVRIATANGNVTIAANASSTWTFDATGNLNLPGNTFAVKYANSTPVDVVTRFESTWTVATGNSTQSFTVDTNNSYQMWVDCNIANGIIVWNATATVTNTNVPVVGAQYAWVYSGGGTPINLTSIPTQFTGTANTLVSSNGAGLGNTNVFVFGFNNTSGVAQTVRYGWIQIS